MSEESEVEMSTFEHDPINPLRDPLYLSPTDVPGVPLSSIKLKNKLNYDVWRGEVMASLRARSKLGFLTGTCQRPTDDREKGEMWDQVHSAILEWLRNSVDISLVPYVPRTGNVRQVWETLRKLFGKSVIERYILRQKPIGMRMGNMSISDYYKVMTDLWAEIDTHDPPVRCTCGGCTCGVNDRLDQRDEENRLLEFLMGLPDRFRIIRTIILMKEPWPSVDDAFDMVKNEEHQLIHAAQMNQSEWQQQGEGSDKPVCGHCHKSGHTREQCYQLIGYPAGWNRRGSRGRKKWSGGRNLGQANQVGMEGSGPLFPQAAGSFPFPYQQSPGQQVPIPPSENSSSSGFTAEQYQEVISALNKVIFGDANVSFAGSYD